MALLDGGADPGLGEPSAIEACLVFRHEEFEGLMREKMERGG